MNARRVDKKNEEKNAKSRDKAVSKVWQKSGQVAADPKTGPLGYGEALQQALRENA